MFSKCYLVSSFIFMYVSMYVFRKVSFHAAMVTDEESHVSSAKLGDVVYVNTIDLDVSF